MNTQEIQTRLAKSLGVDIDKLAEKAGKEEHNIREAWSATVAKVEEFASKYVN